MIKFSTSNNLNPRFVLRVGMMLMLCLISTGQSYAKGPDWWHKLINWVDSADIKGCDTTYLTLPREGFIAYANGYLTGTVMHMTYEFDPLEEPEYETLHGTLRTRPAALYSVGISYRGWGLSYSRDFSDYGDSEFALSSYGQTYGAELRWHKSHSLNGSLDLSVDDEAIGSLDIGAKECNQKTLLGNVYWVFNHKRFSLPAAMSHTILQHKSSGSWIAELNYYYAQTEFEQEMIRQRMSQSVINLGGGYAYNWIFGHGHCLLHTSLMPLISLWHRNKTYYDGMSKTLGQHLSVNANSHICFVYNIDRYLTGFQCNINYDMLSGDDQTFHTFDWTGRLFFGVRF